LFAAVSGDEPVCRKSRIRLYLSRCTPPLTGVRISAFRDGVATARWDRGQLGVKVLRTQGEKSESAVPQ